LIKDENYFSTRQFHRCSNLFLIGSQKKAIQAARKQTGNDGVLENIEQETSSLFIRSIGLQLPFGEIYRDTGL